MLGFLMSWSWWLLSGFLSYSACLGALGTISDGPNRNRLVLRDVLLSTVLLGLQWYAHGHWAFMVTALLCLSVIRPAAHQLMVLQLGGRAPVDPDPDITPGAGWAAAIRTQRPEEWMPHQPRRLAGTLRNEALLQRTGLSPEQLIHLAKVVEKGLGPVRPETIIEIAQRDEVLESYKRWVQKSGYGNRSGYEILNCDGGPEAIRLVAAITGFHS